MKKQPATRGRRVVPYGLALSLACLPLTAVRTYAEVTEENLLAYYNFDGQTENQAGSAPDASLHGPATLSAGGTGFTGRPHDRSLDLGPAGNQAAAQIPGGDHFHSAELNGALAVSFWQLNSEMSDSSAFWIHSTDEKADYRGFQAHTPWGNDRIYLDQAGCCAHDHRIEAPNKERIVPEQWQHIVVQRNPSGLREIWVDGELITSRSGGRALESFNGKLTIGAKWDQELSFGGRIDEFSVWNTALSEEDIGKLASGAHAPAIIKRSIETEHEIVIDSDAGTISIDGVVQEGRFRGANFGVQIRDGIARFNFGGDLQFGSDHVKGVGSNAISLVAAGDVTIAQETIIDISANEASPGPGGGAGGASPDGGNGGEASPGGSGGRGGSGGKGGEAEINGDDRGRDGSTGVRSADTNPGRPGTRGGTGKSGRAGYQADGTEGAGGFSENGGTGGAGATGAAGGAGGAGTDSGEGGRGRAGNRGGFGHNAPAVPFGDPGDGATVSRGTDRLTGGSGGASGQGGGGGGGGGGAGAAGGGGGGGNGGDGGTLFGSGDNGNSGSAGGRGGDGGAGGMGGQGGQGGHGAGALEIIAYGELNVRGHLIAEGGRGHSGEHGVRAINYEGRFGKAGEPKFNSGRGGRGGNGGDGATGGLGAHGGGGAGGSFRFMATTMGTADATLELWGGAGLTSEEETDGDHGRVIVASNIGAFTGSTALDSIESYEGLRGLNTHLSTYGETPYIPNLAGGSDVAGLLDNTNAWSLGLLDTVPAPNARLAIQRLSEGPAGYNHAFPGFDLVLLINLTPETLPNPVLGAGPNHFTAKLRDGGLKKNPHFGGTGATIRREIPPFGVYATLIPSNLSQVTFGYSPVNTLELQSTELTNGQTTTLNYGNPVARGERVAPTDYPVVDISRSYPGPRLSFDLPGEVEVTINPAEAAATPGNGWHIVGHPGVYASGTTAEEIPLGVQTLHFTHVSGWLPPRNKTITVLPGGVTTQVTAEYTKAPTYEIGSISPKSVVTGDLLGFYLSPGTQVSVVSGDPAGALLIGLDGLFTYQPEPGDRTPFAVEFVKGPQSQTVLITPKQDLPQEEEIIALRPKGGNLPDPSSRDYTHIHKGRGTTGVNGNPVETSRIATISGKQVVFDNTPGGDNLLFQEVHDNRNLEELRIYAEEVVFRSEVHVPHTKVTIYAKNLVFDGPDAKLVTTPREAAEGPGRPAGDITLHVLSLSTESARNHRFVLRGGSAADGNGGDAGQLTTPFHPDEMGLLANFAGAERSSDHHNDGSRKPPVQLTQSGSLPVSYCWMHPIGVRAALNYAKDIYALGFMTEATEQFLNYQQLLANITLADLAPLPDLPDAVTPGLQFAELAADTNRHVERLANRLDYYGNPGGWVPMLSFETNFLLTDSAITRAMDTLYVSRWLTRSSEYLQADRDALREAQDNLDEENEALRSEFPELKSEIADLETKEGELELTLQRLRGDLIDIEERLERRAEAIVEERNNVPFWKKAVRGVGSILEVIPVYQPALGAIGAGLDVVSRVDEQSPLKTALDAANVLGEYKVGSMKSEADDLEEKIKPITNEDEKKQKALRDKAEKIEGGLATMNKTAEVLQGFFESNEAPKEEIDAELAKLQASDPEFLRVTTEISMHLDEKQRFAARVRSAQNRLREIPGIIMKNALASERLENSSFELGGILDPQALSVVKESERRAKDRLRKHFYLLAKSFEYRTLEAYHEVGSQAYDPVDVFEKIERIIDAAEGRNTEEDNVNATNGSSPHVLNSHGFGRLESVFQDELQRLADRIINRYQNRGEEKSIEQTGINLLAKTLPGLNEPGCNATLNLAERGFFAPGGETHRIAELNISGVNFELTLDGEPVTVEELGGIHLGSVDIDIVHSGISRLTRDGQTYRFNHFRNADPDDNPISWNFKLNLLTGEIVPTPPSFADQSLLTTLLGSNGALKIQRFSRPAANADLALCVRNLNVALAQGGNAPGEIGLRIKDLTLDYTVDYFSSVGVPEVEIAVLDENNVPLDIRPRFYFDKPGADTEFADENGRRDGLGRIVRSFDENQIEITPEAFYGNDLTSDHAEPAGFRFRHWIGQNGGIISDLPNQLGDRVDGNKLIVSNRSNKRFTAVYEYVGDQTAPVVESIALDLQNSGNGADEYVVTFSEGVAGVDVDDFVGEEIYSVEQEPGSSNVYRVRVKQGSAFGLRDNDTILDRASNALAGEGEGNGDTDFDGKNIIKGVPYLIRVVGFSAHGAPKLQATGPIDSEVVVQVSNDLENWTDLRPEPFVLTDGEALIDDPAGSTERNRFYRLIRR